MQRLFRFLRALGWAAFKTIVSPVLVVLAFRAVREIIKWLTEPHYPVVMPAELDIVAGIMGLCLAGYLIWEESRVVHG